MGASVVAGVDTPPVLEPTEHVLDLGALAVEGYVVRGGDFAVGRSRDAGGDATLGQRGAEPVGIVATIGGQSPRLGEGIDHQRSALVVTHLHFAE